MLNYAIIENNTIINIIVAETIEIAESVTGKTALLCDEPNMAIGSDLFENKWRLPKPFESWVWNNDDWVAPVLPPEPKDCYSWNEDLQEWEQKEGALIASKIKNYL
jgi:hypothetical protein